MGLISSVREGIRDGAAEVLGFSEPLAERDWAMTALQEAGFDARMLARKVEDLNWDKINESPSAYFAPSRENRKEQVARSYNFYFNDPIIRRTVDLRTYYTFAKGVPIPIYRREHEDATQEEREAQDLIDNFFGDEFNQETLTTPKAQYEKSLELQLQGNIYLLGFLDTDTPREKGAQSPLRLSDIPEPEIVEIITHPGNRKVPVYYKRVFMPTSFNFKSGAWVSDATGTTRYYKHYKHEAPTKWEGEDWGPPEELIGEGRVYHISVNHTSDMKWGLTELNSHLKFAAGLNTYMTSRMAMVMALAQMAMQAKTHGGPRSVSQVQGALQDISRLATSIEGTAGMERIPINQGRTKVAMSSKGVQLEPMVQDTGAAAAAADIEMFKGQIASGSAVPVHHLGGQGSAGLATATAMDAPLQKNIEANQTLWEGVFKDLTGWMLTAMGFESERVEVNMPPILTRDFATLAASLAGAIKAVDPKVSSRELVRWYFGEVLDAMGRTNTQELLDKFFPEGWISPAQQEENMMLKLYAARAGGPDEEPAAVPAGLPTLPPTEIAAPAGGSGFPEPQPGYGLGTQVGNGNSSHRGPQDYFGGPVSAGGVKRDRAARRRELALQGAARDAIETASPGLADIIEGVFEEVSLELEETTGTDGE